MPLKWAAVNLKSRTFKINRIKFDLIFIATDLGVLMELRLGQMLLHLHTVLLKCTNENVYSLSTECGSHAMIFQKSIDEIHLNMKINQLKL